MKRALYLTLPLILILSACASLKLPGISASSSPSGQQGQNQPGQNQPGQPLNMANMPVEQKLAMGTLKLEGSDKAVTAEQAKTLLPLWKAVKTLNSSSNTSSQETDALYKQIEESMTADQVQAIKDMQLTPQDTQALMTKYNIQASQPQGNFPTLSPQMQSTMQARRSSRNGGNGGAQGGGPGGFPPGGDMGGIPPDAGGFPGGGPQMNAQGTPAAQGTPRANRGFRGGMNTMFIDPLIKVLQERAGVQ